MPEEKQTLLAESQKIQKSQKWKWISLLLLLVGGGVYWFYFRTEVLKPIPIEYTEAMEKDFKIFVEEEGQIRNPRIVELSFLKTGKVAKINFEEGDRIKSGQKIAQLDARDLWLSIKSSQADVASVEADILKKKSELTNQEVKRLESELVTRESNLEIVKRDAEQAVEESFDLAVVEINTSFYELLEALQTVDDVFRFDSDRGGVQVYRAFNNASKRVDIKNQYERKKRDIENKNQIWNEKSKNGEYAFISQNLWKVGQLATSVGDTLDQTLSLFETANNSDVVSSTDIESYRNRVRESKRKMNEVEGKLLMHKKSTEKSLVEQRNKISEAHDKIDEYATKVENEKEFQVQKETSKSADLQRLAAHKSQYQTRAQTAQYEYEKSIMFAPIDGKIVSINHEVGEIVGPNGTPFVEILSDQAFTVEIEVEELDIVKIARDQKAKVTLASMKQGSIEGTVVYIANKSVEDENGIITYLVKVALNEEGDLPIREGMTATVQFLVERSENAVLLPIEAVYSDEVGQSFVLKENLSEVKVETGLTDGVLIEIKSGVKKGEKIILNPKEVLKDPARLISKKNALTPKDAKPEFQPTKKTPSNIKKELNDAGFTDQEIREIRDDRMSGMLEKKLKKYLESQKNKKK